MTACVTQVGEKLVEALLDQRETRSVFRNAL
jgi:hypothetical protein